jgi:hypothetical protein
LPLRAPSLCLSEAPHRRHLLPISHAGIIRLAEVFISLFEYRDEIKREAGLNPALPRSGVWKRPSP